MNVTARSSTIPTREAQGDYAFPWRPDLGDGTYRNPVLYADYSDPDVMRVGDDFFMTASSFNCTPGLPILHSRDLVNWTLIGHALENLPHPRYCQVQPGCGVWAPAIRHHAGKYWIFFPTPDEGLFVVTAHHPAGPWSQPHCLQEGQGLIDPCPLWDSDGQAYLVHAYAGSRAGIKHRLRVRPMAPDGSRLLGEGEIVFHQPEKYPTLEGPKFLKRDGWYYILAPAGGVETGWQVALRSRNIFGPYEDRIVLSQGATDINGPHQGALVDTAKGDWWFLHFQDAGVYGRIVHLQPVEWLEGWPLMGIGGEPVRHYAKPLILPGQTPCSPPTTDEFNDNALGLQWQWHANHVNDWFSLTARPGWLRLYPQLAVEPPGRQPNFLLQKFPARSFTVETLLQLAALKCREEAGLVISGHKPIMLGFVHDGTRNQVILRTDATVKVLAEIGSGTTIRFRLELQPGGKCALAFAEGANFTAVSQTIQAQKCVWTGAKVGLYSIKTVQDSRAGHVDIDYFRFS